MTETLPARKKVYHIMVQDGRYDNREFDSSKEAETARNKLPIMDRNSTCVQFSWKDIV